MGFNYNDRAATVYHDYILLEDGSGYFLSHCETEIGSDLAQAVNSNDLEAVKTIIGGRFNVDTVITQWGSRALDLACGCEGKSSFKIAQYLLEAGASTQILSEGSETVLHTACRDGNLEIIALLLAQPTPPPLDISNDMRDTSLHLAAILDSDIVIRLLLDAGAKIKADKFGRTPLHCAAAGGSESAVRLLLDAGAEIHSGGGDSPLSYAAGGGHYDVTRLLLREGGLSDLNKRDSKGKTAVMTCLALGCNRLGRGPRQPDEPSDWDEEREKVAWLLIESGADILVTDIDNTTMLHYAARLGAYSMVQYLLNKGVDINAKAMAQEDGFPSERICANTTALHYASRNWDARMVQMLLDNGAQINGIDGLYRNALHLAVLDPGFEPDLDMGLRSYDTARLLVLRGIVVEARDNIGQTPLHYAAWKGGDRLGATMKLLLEHGADVNALDKGRKSPLGYTCRNGFLCTTKLLRLYGADMSGMGKEQEMNLVSLELGLNLERWH